MPRDEVLRIQLMIVVMLAKGSISHSIRMVHVMLLVVNHGWPLTVA